MDAETHRRPAWVNRTAARLTEAAALTDAWFAAHAEPVPAETLYHGLPGCTVHPFPAGQQVDWRPVFAGLAGRGIVGVQQQDPYLLTADQLAALSDVLAAVPWGPAGDPIPFRLTTHLADNDPGKRFQLRSDEQSREIRRRLAAIPRLRPEDRYQAARYNPLHARYVYFELADGERLYMLERGLDVADPRTGKPRTASLVTATELTQCGHRVYTRPWGTF